MAVSRRVVSHNIILKRDNANFCNATFVVILFRYIGIIILRQNDAKHLYNTVYYIYVEGAYYSEVVPTYHYPHRHSTLYGSLNLFRIVMIKQVSKSYYTFYDFKLR